MLRILKIKMIKNNMNLVSVWSKQKRGFYMFKLRYDTKNIIIVMVFNNI